MGRPGFGQLKEHHLHFGREQGRVHRRLAAGQQRRQPRCARREPGGQLGLAHGQAHGKQVGIGRQVGGKANIGRNELDGRQVRPRPHRPGGLEAQQQRVGLGGVGQAAQHQGFAQPQVQQGHREAGLGRG